MKKTIDICDFCESEMTQNTYKLPNGQEVCMRCSMMFDIAINAATADINRRTKVILDNARGMLSLITTLPESSILKWLGTDGIDFRNQAIKELNYLIENSASIKPDLEKGVSETPEAEKKQV